VRTVGLGIPNELSAFLPTNGRIPSMSGGVIAAAASDILCHCGYAKIGSGGTAGTPMTPGVAGVAGAPGTPN